MRLVMTWSAASPGSRPRPLLPLVRLISFQGSFTLSCTTACATSLNRAGFTEAWLRTVGLVMLQTLLHPHSEAVFLRLRRTVHYQLHRVPRVPLSDCRR
jgi:hypothetical protein